MSLGFQEQFHDLADGTAAPGELADIVRTVFGFRTGIGGRSRKAGAAKGSKVQDIVANKADVFPGQSSFGEQGFDNSHFGGRRLKDIIDFQIGGTVAGGRGRTGGNPANLDPVGLKQAKAKAIPDVERLPLASRPHHYHAIGQDPIDVAEEKSYGPESGQEIGRQGCHGKDWSVSNVGNQARMRGHRQQLQADRVQDERQDVGKRRQAEIDGWILGVPTGRDGVIVS